MAAAGRGKRIHDFRDLFRATRNLLNSQALAHVMHPKKMIRMSARVFGLTLMRASATRAMSRQEKRPTSNIMSLLGVTEKVLASDLMTAAFAMSPAATNEHARIVQEFIQFYLPAQNNISFWG